MYETVTIINLIILLIDININLILLF